MLGPVLLAGPAWAADIVATGSQPQGTQWNQATWTGGQWSDGLAPGAGKTYSTAAFTIRTPATNSTFGGASLRVAAGGMLLCKQEEDIVSTATLILDGGTLASGTGFTDGSLQAVAGNVHVNAASFVELSGTSRRRISLRNGALTGGGDLTVSGGTDIDDSFQFEATMTSTHSGRWTINAGRLVVTRDDQIGDQSDVTLAGSTATAFLDVRSDQRMASLSGTGTVRSGISGSRTLRVGGTGASSTFGGVIEDGSGVLSLVKEGIGLLRLTGASTYGGNTTVSGGTLQLGGGSDRLPSGSDIVVSGVLDLDGQSQTFDAVTGTGAIATGGGTLTVGAGNSSFTFGGVIGEFGSLVKSGTGTVTLAGSNTYSGPTTIGAGTLALAPTGSVNGSTPLSLAAGALLDVSAIPAFILGSNAALQATGTGGVAAVIRGGNAVSLGTRPVTLNYDGTNPALVISQGTLSLEGNAFTVNAASPLAVGTYSLIRQATGDVVRSGSHAAGGTAIAPGFSGSVSASGNVVHLTVAALPGTRISVETAADGSGTVVPAQILVAGGSLTVYAIVRAADGSFLANVPAAWSIASFVGGAVDGDLVPAADGKSAVFTGHFAGDATLRASWGGLSSVPALEPLVVGARLSAPEAVEWTATGLPAQPYRVLASRDLELGAEGWRLLGTAYADPGGIIQFLDAPATNDHQHYRLEMSPTDSGTITVVPDTATVVQVETAADGSGILVPAQTIVAGYPLDVFAVTRDALGNFVANVAADSWAVVGATGGVAGSDLAPASGPSATFTGHLPGAGRIRTAFGGLTAVDSGLLTVLSSSALAWSPAPANHLWDTTSTNWVGGSGVFVTGSPVLFSDAGSASSTILLVGALSPGSVIVDVATNHYVFGGAGRLTGSGGMTKTGTGVLTVVNSSANTYTGLTSVHGGTLEIASAASFNTANPSPITVASNATLHMSVAGVVTWSNNVRGAGRWKVATGSGSQTTVLGGDYSSFSGTLEVATGSGKIQLPTAARFPSAAAVLRLDPNTTAFFNNSGTLASAVELYGGITGEALGQLRIRSGMVLSGRVSLFADTSIGVDSGHTAAISGPMSGSGGFTKLSAGTLAVSGADTFEGDTVVSNGTLFVNGTLGHTASTVIVTGGAGVLGGRGVILSPVQVASGGTLSPGTNGLGTLTISNSLTLAGKSFMELNKSSATSDQVAATGRITFGGTLVVSNRAGTLTMGDSFTLFKAGSYAGSFSSISPSTPGSGLVWDLSSLAVDGTLLVMGTGLKTDSVSYAGYTIRVKSRFHAYDSLVSRAYPLYDYSVNVLKVGSSYMAVTGDRYIGSGEDGDHIFGWTSSYGQPDTWSNIKGSSVPLFLQDDTFGVNTMDPELIYNPSNSTWYMYVQEQKSSGDRIRVLTSTDRKNWDPYTSRGVVTNLTSGVSFFLHHPEVIYVPWSSNPFWLYVACREDGDEQNYKLIRSSDPRSFNYASRSDCGGERNFGGQRGYLQEAPDGPLFVRITCASSGGKYVPVLQFSQNGTSWTYSDYAVLEGSSNTGDFGNCYFPGISTINGNGALEYMGHNRWRAIYAATTAAAPTAPEIYTSEIGCGELVITLE